MPKPENDTKRIKDAMKNAASLPEFSSSAPADLDGAGTRVTDDEMQAEQARLSRQQDAGFKAAIAAAAQQENLEAQAGKQKPVIDPNVLIALQKGQITQMAAIRSIKPGKISWQEFRDICAAWQVDFKEFTNKVKQQETAPASSAEQRARANERQEAEDAELARILQSGVVPRNRKPVAAFTPVMDAKKPRRSVSEDAAAAPQPLPDIGSHISLYWKGDKAWYSGLVLDIDKQRQTMLIRYDDQTWVYEPINTTMKKWELKSDKANADLVDPDDGSRWFVRAGNVVHISAPTPPPCPPSRQTSIGSP